MRSVSLGFVRNLLLIGDCAVGFPSAFALDGPDLPRARWSQERSRFVQKGMLSRSPTGVRPMFREQGGRAPLVESGANALIAFKCCIENNRRADFPD